MAYEETQVQAFLEDRARAQLLIAYNSQWHWTDRGLHPCSTAHELKMLFIQVASLL